MILVMRYFRFSWLNKEPKASSANKKKKSFQILILENSNIFFSEGKNKYFFFFRATSAAVCSTVQGREKHTHKEFKPVARFDGIYKVLDLSFIEFKLTYNISINIFCGNKKKKVLELEHK